MTAEDQVHGNRPATNRWRTALVPLLISAGLHGLLATVVLTVPLLRAPTTPESRQQSLQIHIVTLSPRRRESGSPEGAPATAEASTPGKVVTVSPLPETRPAGTENDSGEVAIRSLRPTAGSRDAPEVAEAEPDTGVFIIRESIRGLARAERERLALEGCTETQRRSELFRCGQDHAVAGEIMNGALLADDFLAEPEAARSVENQNLPFTERDPADRVLDNLRTGDPAYELMKRIMGRR